MMDSQGGRNPNWTPKQRPAAAKPYSSTPFRKENKEETEIEKKEWIMKGKGKEER